MKIYIVTMIDSESNKSVLGNWEGDNYEEQYVQVFYKREHAQVAVNNNLPYYGGAVLTIHEFEV